MSLRDIAERYARKRGMWTVRHILVRRTQTAVLLEADTLMISNEAPGLLVSPSGDGSGDLTIGIEGKPDSCRDVDPGTALILTHALATGLRLHVGRCPACEGSKVERERMTVDGPAKADDWAGRKREQGWEVDISRVPDTFRYQLECSRPCPECSEPGPEVECEACNGEGTLDGWPDDADELSWTVVNTTIGRDGTADVPCGRCRRSGKVPGPPQPTGQRWLDPVDWMLACVAAHCCIIDDSMGADEVARREAEFNARCADQTSIRTAASVLADRMQAAGDPWGTLLAAWLAGECGECTGRGWQPGPGVTAIEHPAGRPDELRFVIDCALPVGSALNDRGQIFMAERVDVWLDQQDRYVMAGPGESTAVVDLPSPRAESTVTARPLRGQDHAPAYVDVRVDCDACNGDGVVLGAVAEEVLGGQ